MNEIDNIFNKYDLSNEDEYYLKQIMLPITSNPNFERRMTNEFLHHSDITLGEHIIEDTIMTYLLSKKYLRKHLNTNYRMDLALKISMLHDLYTIPWQNNTNSKVNHFFSKHGFRHPIEAAINAITWYPDIFIDKNDAEIIIDGIIHHMFPLPVRTINEKKIYQAELRNIDNYNSLSTEYKDILKNSLRKKIGVISFSRSKYKEGRIMSKADKKVAMREIKNFSSAKALLTGHNKKIK